jgi:hypothetical protein
MSDEAVSGYTQSGVQKIQDKQLFVGSTINGAFERIQNDQDLSVDPSIQLKEGWQNGNIHYDTVDPTNPIPDPIPIDYPHTWDIWCVVADTESDQWEEITKIFVRVGKA